VPKRELYNKKMHLTFIPLRSTKAGDFSRYRDLFNCDEYIKIDIQKSENIDIMGSAENIPFDDGIFDSVVCTEVFEHLKNPQKAALEIARILKNRGICLLTTPQTVELHEEPHDYFRYTKFGLKYIFEEAGFKIISINQIGGFFTVKAQSNIRYLINRLNLYSHKWARIFNPLFRVYSEIMFFFDRIDKSKANKKFAMNWCIIVQKL